MMLFLLFAVLITLATAGLIIWPIALHPSLPAYRKRQFIALLTMLFLPGGFGLYLWLGAPQIIRLLTLI